VRSQCREPLESISTQHPSKRGKKGGERRTVRRVAFFQKKGEKKGRKEERPDRVAQVPGLKKGGEKKGKEKEKHGGIL